MVIHVLNGVWSDIYILQIITIQRKMKMLTKRKVQKNLISKTSSVKIRDIEKIEKRALLPLSFLVLIIRKKIQSMYQKNVVKKNKFIYY